MIDCIDLHLGAAGIINEWRFKFRSYFNVLRPFLSPTGQVAAYWCCPYNGQRQEIAGDTKRQAAGRPERKTSPCVEARDIPPEELELWSFCPTALVKELAAGLGLHPATNPMKGEILRLGSLLYRSKRYPAYLVRQGEGGYALQVQAIAGGHKRRCLFFTPRFCPDTADWLTRHGYGYFPLEDLLLPGSLAPSPEYWQTLQACKELLSRPEKGGAEPPHPVENVRPGIFIEPSFKRIIFPDGSEVNLSRAYKRRTVVRFIHEQLALSGSREFDVEVMREAYNRQHPGNPWNSDRIREDLFKRHYEDFDRLFETVNAANGRYRMTI